MALIWLLGCRGCANLPDTKQTITIRTTGTNSVRRDTKTSANSSQSSLASEDSFTRNINNNNKSNTSSALDSPATQTKGAGIGVLDFSAVVQTSGLFFGRTSSLRNSNKNNNHMNKSTNVLLQPLTPNIGVSGSQVLDREKSIDKDYVRLNWNGNSHINSRSNSPCDLKGEPGADGDYNNNMNRDDDFVLL